MKKNKFWVLMIGSMVSGLAGGFLGNLLSASETVFAQGTPAPSVVSARAVHIIDDDGNLRGTFGLDAVTEEEPGIVLFDRSGKDRVKLSLMPDGVPLMSLHDADGEVRTLMVVGTDGQPFLDLFGKGNRAHVVLGVYSDGRPNLSLYDKEGRIRADFILSAAGNPGIVFLDDHNGARSSLGLWPDGDPFMAIANQDGVARIAVGHTHGP